MTAKGHESEVTDQTGISRQFLGWCLFDFANSILIINGGLYFPQWIVVDNGISDFWFNSSLVLSTILLIASAPVLGLLSDKSIGRLPFLKMTSLAMFLSTIGIDLLHRLLPTGQTKGTLSLIAFAIIIYSYQLGLVFYNTLLANVSSPSRYGRRSGLGLASGWIGGIVGIFLILPFVEGHVPLFQPPGRFQAFLPSAVIFGVLTVISLIMIGKEPVQTVDRMSKRPIQLYRDLLQDGASLVRSSRHLAIFLLAYLLYSDAILTIENNSPIYLERVMHFQDTQKAYLFLLFLFAAAVGGVVSGFSIARVGHRNTLLGVLIGWLILLSTVALTSNADLFAVLFGLLGLLYGGVWNTSRVLFLILIPADRRAEHFGIYSTFERFASLLGPLLWSGPIVLLAGLGILSYRLSMGVMALLVLLSIVVLTRIRFPERM